MRTGTATLGSMAVGLGVVFLALAAWAATATGDNGVQAKKAKKLIADSNCSSCHAEDHKVVGPAFKSVAKRYAGGGDKVVRKLAMKIKKGGAGNWGDVPMPAHPNMNMADLETITRWVLSLNNAKAATAQQAQQKTYTYTRDGKKITVDFQVFQDKKQQQVTKSIFSGYELYNSYCFRCHGPDAVGGEYAPDLRHSLTTGGMTHQQFVEIAMTGRKAKGMPSWAGFFSEEQINQIYDYVKARSTDLVPAGRPQTAD